MGDGRRWVEDGVLAQGRFVGADALGVAAAEGVVGERAGSALGVVDDGDLEQRAVGQASFSASWPMKATSLITSG